MASATPDEGIASTPRIRVNIVSPSADVPEHLTFADVSVNETVADLKSRIQQAIPNRPLPERQRIIYQGRALIQPDLQLHSVLGSEVSHTNNTFTFHLVLSPVNASSSTTAQSDNPYQPSGLPSLPGLPNAAQLFNMPPRPASTSQIPEPEPGQGQGVHAQNMPFVSLPGAMNQWTQQIPGGVQMQFATTGRPLHHAHLPTGLNPQNNQVPMMNGPPPQWLQDAQMQMLITQQHLPHQIVQDMMNRGRHATRFDPQAGGHLPGQAQAQFPPRDASGTRNMPNPTITTQHYSFQGLPPNLVADTAGRTSRPHSVTRQFQASASLGPMQAAHIHALRQNHIQNMQIDQLSQFAQLRNAIANPLQGLRQNVTATTVYLLSSPRGPEALVMSPAGIFTSPGHSMVAHIPSQNERGTTGASVSDNRDIPSVPQPTPTIAHAPQAQQEQQQQQQQPQIQQQAQPPQLQQQQPQPPDQVGDLLRILLPLGGQLWLIVRIIGFIYLFSSGRGWRNTVMLGIIAFIGLVAQTGVFDPLLRSIWRPIRQHVEGIINSEQPRPLSSDVADQTPQQMAERLMGQRRENDNALRRALRRAERSAILFAASLIPGVGESQVRAREAAERAQREAEEAAERARQEAEQAATEKEADDEDNKENHPLLDEKNAAQTPVATADAQLIDVD